MDKTHKTQNKVPIDADAGPYRLLSADNAASSDTDSDWTSDGGHSRELAANLTQSQWARLDLFIDNIQAGQTTGDYVCLASNSEGSIETRSQVILAVPAVITTMPRNQTRLEGERVEMLCQAKALPSNITYKWFFNEKPLQQLKWFDSRFTIKQRDGTLIIHSLHRDDQGEYKCQATNGLAHRSRHSSTGLGSQQTGANNKLSPIYAEAAAHLQVEFPARVTYSPPVQYLPLGMSGQIRCFVQAAPEVEFFTWTLNNQQFDPNADPNVERMSNGSLLIKRVSKLYEGRYRCTPFNKHGSAGSSNAMEVRVEEPPQFELRPAEFYKATLNGALKIPCDARASPRPSVSWRRVSLSSSPPSEPKGGPSSSTSSATSRPEEAANQRGGEPLRVERSLRGPTTAARTGGARSLNVTSTAVRLTSRQKLPTGRAMAESKLGSRSTRRLVASAEASPHLQAHLAYDEAADEPDETHQFYAQTTAANLPPTGTSGQESERATGGDQAQDAAYQSNQVPAEPSEQGQGQSVASGQEHVAGQQTTGSQQLEGLRQQQQEQPTVIVSYSKLPPERSEQKGSYLYLHNLRKEDHGRYECVIENEVATLVASTMLYIEETTPHAPTDVRVETKAWSAKVSWTPGYDGGFEQSFVVSFRQVERSSDRTAGHQQTETLVRGSPAKTSEPIDVNWHSANVQPSDATSFTVQNLSQDSTYEFYVRAKNIIGEGPRSQVIQASTKRAANGLVTPISNSLDFAPDPSAAASSAPGGAQDLAPTQSPPVTTDDQDESEDRTTLANQQSIAQTSIRPYLIIHPEYIKSTSVSPNELPDTDRSPIETSSSVEGEQQASESNRQNYSTGTAQNNKVIKIYFPSGNKLNQADATSASNKKTRTEQRQATDSSHQSSNSTPSDPAGEPKGNSLADQKAPEINIDYSTAPQNVSMSKVAQGWVLSWEAPLRMPELGDSAGHPEPQAEPMFRQQPRDSLLPALSQIDGSLFNQQQLAANQRPQMKQTQPSAYSIELREKNSTQWHTLATARENSLLLKDLRPGSEYSFRVIAHSTSGLKGTPSAEFKYQIPDNRRKPGSTQALSAGVVSGFLFFIACIVIAVCGVNMCNKRRKKRAEKSAYVMMACPVLESHHDIAALNTNSLIKNSSSPNAPEGGVSSLGKEQSDEGQYHLFKWLESVGKSGRAKLELLLRQTSQGSPKNHTSSNSQPTRYREPISNGQPTTNGLSLEREINFSSNEPLPVDVEGVEESGRVVNLSRRGEKGGKGQPNGEQKQQWKQQQHEGNSIQSTAVAPGSLGGQPNGQLQTGGNQSLDNNEGQRATPLDDYWIRQPSDRKWGTLTVAASKLAERRALAAAVQAAGGGERAGEPNRLAAAFGKTAGEWQANGATCVWPNRPNRTLPRSFRSAPTGGKLFSPLQLASGRPELGGGRPLGQMSPGARQGSPEVGRAVGALHKRSYSHVEGRPQQTQPAQSQGQGAAAGARRPPNGDGGAPKWWWWQAASEGDKRREVEDFASMSFGPPAELVLERDEPQAGQQTGSRGPLWWPEGGAAVGGQLGGQSSLLAAAGCASGEQQRSGGQTEIGRRNCLARSTHPLATQTGGPSLSGRTVLAPPYHPAHDAANKQLDSQTGANEISPNSSLDDPLAGQNVCFGSYKRRRRLPHIEAQFTITPNEPALDTGDNPNSLVHNRAPRPPPRNERDALQKGQLFVRELPRGERPRRLSGYPQQGQRTEALRLRVSAKDMRPPVDTIDAKEKIETFLRHHQHPMELAEGQLEPETVYQAKASPVRIDQLHELTFQPYYNLPSLKYTISLPLRQTSDGTLLVQATSHLRPHKRRTMPHSRTLSSPYHAPSERKAVSPMERRGPRVDHCDSGAADLRDQRARLSSSSSAPATGAKSALVGAITSNGICSLAESGKQNGQQAAGEGRVACERRSLESALDNPRLANRPQLAIETNVLIEQDSLDTPAAKYLGPVRVSRCEHSDQPPPVPPHRRKGQLVEASRSGQLAATNVSTTHPNDQLGSPASNNDSTTSSRSSSTGHEQNSGDKTSDSTATTNDNHSVDDQYEFDQLSEASSFNVGALRRRMDRISSSGRRAREEPRSQLNGNTELPVYTKVNKSKKKNRSTNPQAGQIKGFNSECLANRLCSTENGSENGHSESRRERVATKTRYYDDASRKKEQTLTKVPGLRSKMELSHNGNLYDTVFESKEIDNTYHSTDSENRLQ